MSRHEKRVDRHLRLRAIENFLPLYRKRRQWKDGSKGLVEVPLFPNYIFVRIGNGEHVPVLRVPGVISIVGAGSRSLPVPDSLIHSLREAVRCGKVEPYPYLGLAVGTPVRIRSGVMAGVHGVLLRQKNNLRVVITLEMMMNSATIEVEAEEIEPVGRLPVGSATELTESQRLTG